jgi:hypothetical protein
MKNIIVTALLALAVAGLGIAPANAACVDINAIDTTVDSHGMVEAKYKGETYHLTEGDKLGKVTIVLIDKTDGEVIVKKHNHLKEYKVNVK